MVHLDGLMIPSQAILLGEPENQWGWEAYKTTWNLLIGGTDDFESLPLFESYRRYYSKLKKKERTKELKKYGLKHGDSKEIARERLRRETSRYGEINAEDFVADVHIGENGEVVVDGEHAASVSVMKHLRETPIKVNVVSRHKEWLRLKELLFEINGEQSLYQPVEHPDFADWPVTGDSQRQLDAILASCDSIRNKHLLDAGAGTGWFSRRFTSAGVYVVGTEPDMTKYYVATRLSKIFGFGSAYPAYFQESYVDVLEKRIVHPSEPGQTRFEAILFLDKIRGVDDAPWNGLRLVSEYGKSAYVDAPAEWNPEQVLSHTEFESYEKILDGGSPLYVYRRGRP